VFGDYADSWALAFLFEDVAAVAAEVGDAERALRLMGAAGAIGTVRSPTEAETQARALAPAYARLTEDEQQRALEDGRALGLEAALAEALDVCAHAVAG
jgi:hypothetical protein